MQRWRRSMGRIAVSGFLVGALLTASGLAGVVVDPLGIGSGGTPGPDQQALDHASPQALGALATAGDGAPEEEGDDGDEEILPNEVRDVLDADVAAPNAEAKGSGFEVGAARASLYPSPDHFGGGTWQTAECTAIEDGQLDLDHAVQSMEDLRGWPAASPDCVYLGGFGIGPVRPATRVGHGGVWVRAVAITNQHETFVYAIADTVGWFARYDSAICSDCGILDVREAAATALGIPLANVIVGSTHTHAGADTYGGWGGIPDWYRAQLRDATVAAVKRAVQNRVPATVTAGEVHLRERNNERRDTYYSNADTAATWVRAVDSVSGDAIATWATFAAHPTIVSDPILHADWPGATSRYFEAVGGGGVGLVFEGGLGNVSVNGSHPLDCAALEITGEECEAERAGAGIGARVLADVEDGGSDDLALTTNEMERAVQTITHPAMTNPGLTTLASAGLFDREFTPDTPGAGLPGAYHWSRRGELSSSGETNTLPSDPEDDRAYVNGCSSAGPTIITAAGAHKIGDLLVAFAPGEIFSNIAEVVRERADQNNAVAMVLGQTNDALGYIIQNFEFDTAANVATEYATGTHEYEEVFSIDRCFGDHVLETLLESTSTLGFGR